MKIEFYKKLVINLIINLLVALVSVVLALVSSKSEYEIIRQLMVVISFAIIIIIVALYLTIAILELRDIKLQINENNNELELMNTIPYVFVFKNRTDTFTISEDGDAELEWDFEIEKETDESITFINFPILCERKDDDTNMDSVSVEVKKLIVNGNEQYNAKYELKSINIPKDSKRSIEQGCVHVRLDSDTKKGAIFNVNIVLILKKVYYFVETEEFVVVDIPYITQNLTLNIVPKSSEQIIEVVNNFFNVHEVNGNNTDNDEKAKQCKKCITKNNGIIWKTEYPKLGYRYELSFTMHKKVNNLPVTLK